MSTSSLLKKYYIDIKVVCNKKHPRLEIGKIYTYHTMAEGEDKSYEEYYILENEEWIDTHYFVSLSQWREEQINKIF